MNDRQDRALAIYAATPRDREPVLDADLQGLHDTFVEGLCRHRRTLAPVFEEMQWLRNEVERIEDELAGAQDILKREEII